MRPELGEILQLLGEQAQAIDHGDGPGWADAFADDGVFSSPSYPDPVVGRAALARFGAAFVLDHPGAQHLLSNTHLIRRDDAWVARSRLLVVRDTGHHTELLRLTTIEDSLTHTRAGWRIAHREVRRPTPRRQNDQ